MATSTSRIDSHNPTPIQPGQIDCKIEFPLLVVTDVKPKHCSIQVFRYVASYYTYKSAILNVVSDYILVIHVNEPSSSNVNLEEFIFTNNLSSADIKAVSTKTGQSTYTMLTLVVSNHNHKEFILINNLLWCHQSHMHWNWTKHLCYANISYSES